MPLYEFSCSRCGKEFEELVMKKDEKVLCPSCGGNDVKKLMSAFAFKSESGFTPSSGSSGSCGSCTSSSCSTCGVK